MNQMTYKGYTAKIEYNTVDRVFVGRVLGIRDVIAFHADNVDGLEKEFHGMIDFYLDQCAKDGIDPNRAYSGKLNLRMPPEKHRRLSIEAEMTGQSINDLILSAINTVYPELLSADTAGHPIASTEQKRKKDFVAN